MLKSTTMTGSIHEARAGNCQGPPKGIARNRGGDKKTSLRGKILSEKISGPAFFPSIPKWEKKPENGEGSGVLCGAARWIVTWPL